MEREKFVYYLETIYKLYNVPMAYGYDGEVKHRFEPYSMQSQKAEWAFMSEEIESKFHKAGSENIHAMYYIYPNMIFLGAIKKINAPSKEFVYLGPIPSINSQESEFGEFVFKSGLDAQDVNTLKAFLKKNKMLSLNQFLNILCNINTVLNETILYPKDLHDLSSKATIEFARNITKDVKHRNSGEDVLQNTKIKDDFTKKLVYAIKNGQPETVAELWEEVPYIQFEDSVMSHSNIREFRNTAVGAITLAHYIAADSGLSTQFLDDIKYYHLNRTEEAKTFEAMAEIIYRALVDFAERVQKNNNVITNNPSLNRVIQYIQTNITSKLTAEQISKDLNINQVYIFNKFKSELNTTLSQFILEERIKKAVHLLLFTEKPLIEISNYLSFSSQSYFQKSFKKVMGITPTEFRIQNGLNI